MMPLYWRYAISQYLQIFFLSVISFLGVLTLSRLKELARFAALSGDLFQTGWFLFYQFPLILPMAIPLSALIASLLCMQRLSQNQELTALRSLGWSLPSLLSPFLFCSLLLGGGHFYLTMEVTPLCKRKIQDLLYKAPSDNPLLLLQRQSLIPLKSTYLDMQVQQDGETIENLLWIGYLQKTDSLALFRAQKLQLAQEELLGDRITWLCYPSSHPTSFNPLFLENQEHICMNSPLLSSILYQKRPRLDHASLSGKMLQIRASEDPSRALGVQSELYRRLWLTLSVCSFPFLSLAFGIESSRVPSKKPLTLLIFWILFLLATYFIGKTLKHTPPASAAAFFFPQILASLGALWQLRRVQQGRSL